MPHSPSWRNARPRQLPRQRGRSGSQHLRASTRGLAPGWTRPLSKTAIASHRHIAYHRYDAYHRQTTYDTDSFPMKIASPWTVYGLRSDPYFQEPLIPDGETGTGAHSAGLFVGRAKEIELLGRQIIGSLSSRAIIQGRPGVGKTSFANRLKTVLADPKTSEAIVLCHEQPVRFRAAMTPQDFTLEVLRTLLLIHTTRATGAKPSKKKSVAFWRRIERVLHGEDFLDGGIGVGVVSASIARSRIPAEQPTLSLYRELEEAFALLAEGGKYRTLIHVNNLENLTRAETQHAAGVIQDLRDYFLIPHSHWIFVGADGIEHTLFRKTPQVSGIVPFAITLTPLATVEAVEMLELRYKHLALRGGTRVPPVAPKHAAALYGRYRGDLRNFLRALSKAVQRAPIAEPVRSLSEEEIIAALAADYRQDLKARLSEGDLISLEKILTGKNAGASFRVADVRDATGFSQPSASDLVGRLVEAGIAYLERTEGRNAYYRLSGDATIAFGLLHAQG